MAHYVSADAQPPIPHNLFYCTMCGKDVPIDRAHVCLESTDSNSNGSNVDHPAHYGGADNPYEVIKVIEAWGLDFCLGNTVKYIARAGKKDPRAHLEDLRKAAWYLQRRISQIESEGNK